MSGTNGKTDPRITAAMAALQTAEAALAKIDGERKELEGKLASVTAALAAAQTRHAQAAENYADNDNDKNRAALFKTSGEVSECEAKLRVLQPRLQRLLGARQPLYDAVQTANITLAKLQRAQRLHESEKEEDAAKLELGTYQQKVFEQQKVVNRLATMRRELQQQIANGDWAEQRVAAKAHFLRHNPDPRPRHTD
jgi:flagellar biosynthesis chaperone FliJ